MYCVYGNPLWTLGGFSTNHTLFSPVVGSLRHDDASDLSHAFFGGRQALRLGNGFSRFTYESILQSQNVLREKQHVLFMYNDPSSSREVESNCCAGWAFTQAWQACRNLFGKVIAPYIVAHWFTRRNYKFSNTYRQKKERDSTK